MKYNPLLQSDREFARGFIKNLAVSKYKKTTESERNEIKKQADEFKDLNKIYEFARLCYAADDYMKVLYYITIGHSESHHWTKGEEVIFKLALEEVSNKAEEIKKEGFGYEEDNPIEFNKMVDGVRTSYDYMWRLICDSEKTSYRLVDYKRTGSIRNNKDHNVDVWKVYLVEKGVEDKLFFVNLYLDADCEMSDVDAPEGFELFEYRPNAPKKTYK